MSDNLNSIIRDEEFLYRGIIEQNWDCKKNRPNSATFKDSKGVSVDRDGQRDEKDCVEFLKSNRDYFAVCKVKTQKVKELNAVPIHKPIKENPYHSEIHDSEERIQMKGSKPKKLRDASVVVFNK